jgi:hypothetical protein
VPEPHYVKIDVDGFEPKVIAGAAGVLRWQASEIAAGGDQSDTCPITSSWSRTCTPWAIATTPPGATRGAQSGPFIGCAEYVFERR